MKEIFSLGKHENNTFLFFFFLLRVLRWGIQHSVLFWFYLLMIFLSFLQIFFFVWFQRKRFVILLEMNFGHFTWNYSKNNVSLFFLFNIINLCFSRKWIIFKCNFWQILNIRCTNFLKHSYACVPVLILHFLSCNRQVRVDEKKMIKITNINNGILFLWIIWIEYIRNSSQFHEKYFHLKIKKLFILWTELVKTLEMTSI